MALDLRDRIVLITGASSGIGAACARLFARAGARLLLSARRADRLAELADELGSSAGVPVHSFALDVRDRRAVEAAFAALPPAWRAIDVLINNAGLSRGLDPVQEGKLEDWDEMLDTNVKGLLHVTRCAVPLMLPRGAGHIVNIGSIAGRQTYPRGAVYCASKAAVRALSEGMRLDLLGTGIRVSEIAPGMVETEFSLVRHRGDAGRAAATYDGVTPLVAEDIAEIVFFCASRPPHVNIGEVVVTPTDQASTAHVFRRAARPGS
jgi:NADP-dependent 3-hydroxy acid dehydrogenase YdfG